MSTSLPPPNPHPTYQHLVIRWWWVGILDVATGQISQRRRSTLGTGLRYVPVEYSAEELRYRATLNGDPVPQHVDAFPLEYRCYFPAVYFPVRYRDCTQAELQRHPHCTGKDASASGNACSLAHETFGLHAALRMLEAANALLDWQQTPRTMTARLRRLGACVLEESTGMAFTLGTSPLFAPEIPVRFRPPPRSRRHTKLQDSLTRSPTLNTVLMRESQRQRGIRLAPHPELGVEAPHDKRTTASPQRPPPTPLLPPTTEFQDATPLPERKEYFGVQPDDSSLERPVGLSPSVVGLPSDWNYPASAGKPE